MSIQEPVNHYPFKLNYIERNAKSDHMTPQPVGTNENRQKFYIKYQIGDQQYLERQMDKYFKQLRKIMFYKPSLSNEQENFCKQCQRKFASHQALGGHVSASHKREKKGSKQIQSQAHIASNQLTNILSPVHLGKNMEKNSSQCNSIKEKRLIKSKTKLRKLGVCRKIQGDSEQMNQQCKLKRKICKDRKKQSKQVENNRSELITCSTSRARVQTQNGQKTNN